MFELLTPKQMARADQITIKSGTRGIQLMENAGAGVAKVVHEHFPHTRSVLIVCGTGNNGGDGFIAARLLQEAGQQVAVYVVGDHSQINGDAQLAFSELDKEILLRSPPGMNNYDLIIDALLGAGLDRDVKGNLADIIEAINASGKPVLSVDLPSGIDGVSGAIRGVAIKATRSITFFRYKPGHILMPGRFNCGHLHLHQIGIPSSVMEKIQSEGRLNIKALWDHEYPIPALCGHKYDRGHVLAISGSITNAGASRLMAKAALRIGAGLVTLASPSDALIVNASRLTSIMLREANSSSQLVDILTDKRFNCIAMGPGLPPDQQTCKLVETVLQQDRITVLDAGALSCFKSNPQWLFDLIKAKNTATVITPHEGEFGSIFPQENSLLSKTDKARCAARICGATVLLKGPDSVVATPEGQTSVSNHAPAWLATAGSGDVLAGIVAGLLAQGMAEFEAASAAVWIHSEAANLLGPGMISSDLDHGLKKVVGQMIAT